MSDFYRIFNTTFSCDFPLPGLPPATVSQAPLAVKLAAAAQFDLDGFERKFIWFNVHGKPTCWCERRGRDHLFVFPGFASYHVSADDVISCLPAPDASMLMLQHLLLNQIIPRYLATNGCLVLHASAVTLGSGPTIAFLGNSGFGKSTLAASFHRHGAILIDDDCIMLDPCARGATVVGGYPGIRLFPDSMHAVFSETAGFSAYSPYSDKQQMLLQNEAGGAALTPRSLDALFLLADPHVGELARTVQITPLSGPQMMMEMTGCAFSLDPTDKPLIVQNFRHIGATITPRLGMYKLGYPRDHKYLSAVRESVASYLG